MDGQRLLRYGATTALVFGCGLSQVLPDVQPGQGISPNDTPQATVTAFTDQDVYLTPTVTNTPYVTETPTPAPDVYYSETSINCNSLPEVLINGALPSESDLVTPEVRETAIVATAVSVQCEGELGLINNDAFPEVAISSQSIVDNKFTVTAKVDGEEYSADISFKLDSTIVNMDGTEFADYLVYISAGHGVSEGIKAQTLQSIMIDRKTTDVQIEKLDLMEIRLGGDLTLKPGEFGYSFADDANQDFNITVIPLKNIPTDVADKLKKSAVPYKDLMFDKNPPNDGYYGYCKPGTSDYKPIVAINAENVGWDFYNPQFVDIEPYMADPGCSGSGVFVKTKDGVKYFGIVVQRRNWIPGEAKFTVVFPLSKIGETSFMEQVRHITGKSENTDTLK